MKRDDPDIAMVLVATAAALALATSWTSHIGGFGVVSGVSMEPTAAHGMIVYIDKAASPRRGDVIAFDPPASWQTQAVLIKRIVAEAGVHAECCDGGRVILDGEAVEDDSWSTRGGADQIRFSVVVPEGHLLVLGDNRNRSIDSRQHLHDEHRGCIPIDSVIGVVHGLPAATAGITTAN